jgi:hypothetical protein
MQSFIPRSGIDLQPNVAVGGYVGKRSVRGHQPHRGCVALKLDTQGSRSDNPGLEVVTASRYQSFLQFVAAFVVDVVGATTNGQVLPTSLQRRN